MKKNIFLSIVILFTAFSCSDDGIDPDHSAPLFVSASVNTEESNKVTVNFNEALFTGKEGFTIRVNSTDRSISEIEGSGTSVITFILESNIVYGDDITISYDASLGNATNQNDIRLSTFAEKSVTNSIEETDLSVFIPNIPPDARDDIIWLVIKNGQTASAWQWNDAAINMRLTASPVETPFDIVIYATGDDNWRPDTQFSTGYYATLLNQTNKYQQLKVVTWQKGPTLSGTDMGYINSESTPVENTSLNNAYTLRTDGLDYVEGNIIDNTYELWYKFPTQSGTEYKVTIFDYYDYSDSFSGIVKAVFYDEFEFELDEISSVIGSHPTLFTGNGETIYVRVMKSDLGGKIGTFQILTEAQ